MNWTLFHILSGFWIHRPWICTFQRTAVFRKHMNTYEQTHQVVWMIQSIQPSSHKCDFCTVKQSKKQTVLVSLHYCQCYFKGCVLSKPKLVGLDFFIFCMCICMRLWTHSHRSPLYSHSDGLTKFDLPNISWKSATRIKSVLCSSVHIVENKRIRESELFSCAVILILVN